MSIEQLPEFYQHENRKGLIHAQLLIMFHNHNMDLTENDKQNLGLIFDTYPDLVDLYDENPDGVVKDIFAKLKNMQTPN